MRFLVMVKAKKDSEAGVMPSRALLEAMGRFNDELRAAGVLQTADGLQPSAKGSRVQFNRDGKRVRVDGPFAETKELVAGFWLWECKSHEEAMKWALKCPPPFENQDCEIEIRPVYGPEAFEQITPK